MKKHLIISLLCLALGCLWGRAADLAYLNLKLNDGAVYSYAFASQPELIFPDASTLLILTQQEEVSYPIADIASYFFSESPAAGIAAPVADVQNITFRFTAPNRVEIAAEGPVTARLFTMSGAVVLSAQKGTSMPTMEVSLEDLPTGVYLLNVNNRQTVKILKK
ncbi:MAG: T9SS type A sorting domain-containing protein [Bacteroidales bacterium]|nr:T9SS type A sorting domain-containing protein [Bacteroidales bacterium]